MSIAPAASKESQPAPTSALQPVIDNTPEEMPEYLQNLSIVAKLTTTRRLILTALALNILSEDKQTETAIAERIGVSRQSIYDARQDPVFGQALSLVMRSIIAGKSDIITEMLLTRAEKSDRILEICARIAELYQPTQRNVNINASISASTDTPGSPQQAVQATLQLFMGIGYDLDSFVGLVREQWRKLKEEGL